MDLRITGTTGVINIDNFLSQNQDGSADFSYRSGGWGGQSDEINIASDKPGAVLMFEDMAAAAADTSLRDQWMTATAPNANLSRCSLGRRTAKRVTDRYRRVVKT